MTTNTPWTIIAFYEDNAQKFADTVFAPTAAEAMAEIVRTHPNLVVAGIVAGDLPMADAGRSIIYRKPREWTVVGYRNETNEPYAETFVARSWQEAGTMCLTQIGDEDFMIVGILDGRHEMADARLEAVGMRP